MTQPTTATVLGALARERLFDLSRIFGAGLRASRQTRAQVAQALAHILELAHIHHWNRTHATGVHRP